MRPGRPAALRRTRVPSSLRHSWIRATHSWANSLVSQVLHAAVPDADPCARLKDDRLERREGALLPRRPQYRAVRRAQIADLHLPADQRYAQVQPGNGSLGVGDPQWPGPPGHHVEVEHRLPPEHVVSVERDPCPVIEDQDAKWRALAAQDAPRLLVQADTALAAGARLGIVEVLAGAEHPVDHDGRPVAGGLVVGHLDGQAASGLG